MTTDTPGVAALRHAREHVLEAIATACARAGRDPAAVTLVAVSKTVEVDRLRDAVAAGLDILGENRVQEAVAKAGDVPGARWHLVGPLQSNKVRLALETFETIQAVGSVKLAERIDRVAGDLGRERVPVLVQVNVDLDPSKAGFRPGDLPAAIAPIAALERLDVRGLMTIGRLVERPDEARATFAGLRELAVRLRVTAPWIGPELSMGMSDDYQLAVEEGATIVRVGRALFGERPYEQQVRQRRP